LRFRKKRLVLRHATGESWNFSFLHGHAAGCRKISGYINLLKRISMTETTEVAASPVLPPLPDHLSADPRSPHHVAAVFAHDIGIRLGSKELTNVEEYCISEGWVKVPADKTRDRKGNPLLIKLKGKVEAFYR
jgi:hypothetical protein